MDQMNNLARGLRKVCVLGVISLLCVLFTSCGPTGSQQPASDQATPTPLPTPIIPEKPTYIAQAGMVIETLEFTGRASPVLEQELFFKTEGLIGKVFVDRGAWVQAGDVLAELEIDDLKSLLAQKQIAQETAQIRLQQAQVEASQAITTAQIKLDEAKNSLESAQAAMSNEQATLANDLASARAAVKEAEVQLENAKQNLTVVQKSDVVAKNVRDREYEHAWFEANYGEYLKKYERGEVDKTRVDLERNALLTAKERLDSARAEAALALGEATARVTQAQENLRQAKAHLAALEGGGDVQAQIQVDNAELAVSKAEMDYRQAVSDADPQSDSLKLLELESRQSQLDVQDLERQIANAQLIAPFGGQVLSLNVNPGDSLHAFDTAIVLGDSAELEITARLDADALSQMALDQEAMIVLRGRPEEALYGRVRELPYPYGGGTLGTDNNEEVVRIAIGGGVDLELGELVTIIITLEERDNVLWLPPAAIRTFEGRKFVVVQEGAGQRRVDVTLGIESEDRVEIVAGLEEGQVVIGP